MNALLPVVLLMLSGVQKESPPATLAITNVTLIDTSAISPERAHRGDQTVLIAEGRIVGVGPRGSFEMAKKVRVVDGGGKFLIPGLWDMHVHLNRDENTVTRVMGPLMIAHGVTAVRDMESDCWEPCATGRLNLEEMRSLQERLESGEILGPRLLALSSAIVWGPPGVSRYPADAPPHYRPRTEEDARTLARYLKSRGVGFVKTYNEFPREPFFAMMEEAQRIGLSVSGHLPWAVSPIEAAKAGMRTIEHARWPALACGPAYEEFRAAFAQFVDGTTETFPEESFARLRDTAVSGFDETRCRAMLRELAAHDTHLVPTHVTRKMDAFAADPEYRADPRRRYIPKLRLRGWDRDLKATASGSPEVLEFYRDFFLLGLRITGMAHEEGVTVLTGTDTLDTHAFPGFSLHDELQHLVQAGFTPLAALQAATIRCAEFLALADRYGTIAQGKAADLILLDADPLTDIQNTARIHAVVFRGEFFPRSRLDEMLRQVEAYANPTLVDLPLDGAGRNVYQGEYLAPEEPHLRVLEEDGKLAIRWGEGHSFRIVYQGEHRFRVEAVPQLELVFGIEGREAVSVTLRRDGEEAIYQKAP